MICGILVSKSGIFLIFCLLSFISVFDINSKTVKSPKIEFSRDPCPMKPLCIRNYRDLKIVSVIERYPLCRGSSKLDYLASKICSGILRCSAVCQEASVRKCESLKQYTKGYQTDMMIWKPLVGECLQCVKETYNKWERMLLLWFILIRLVMCNRNLVLKILSGQICWKHFPKSFRGLGTFFVIEQPLTVTPLFYAKKSFKPFLKHDYFVLLRHLLTHF